MTETELRDAHGMSRHERRQFDDPDGYGVGCSCGKDWPHPIDKPHQHTTQDPEPGCEFCEARQ